MLLRFDICRWYYNDLLSSESYILGGVYSALSYWF